MNKFSVFALIIAALLIGGFLVFKNELGVVKNSNESVSESQLISPGVASSDNTPPTTSEGVVETPPINPSITSLTDMPPSRIGPVLTPLFVQGLKKGDIMEEMEVIANKEYTFAWRYYDTGNDTIEWSVYWQLGRTPKLTNNPKIVRGCSVAPGCLLEAKQVFVPEHPMDPRGGVVEMEVYAVKNGNRVRGLSAHQFYLNIK